MFKDLSIKSRLTLVVGLLSLLLLMIGIMGLVGMSKANEGLLSENERLAVTVGQIDQIESLILDNRLQLSLALLDSDVAEIERQTGLVEKHLDQISKIWKSYTTTESSPEEKVVAARSRAFAVAARKAVFVAAAEAPCVAESFALKAL